MKTYDLYLESGPMMKKTMAHVPSLMGCIARGETTQAALDATDEAIRAYLRFLARHSERADAKAAFRKKIAGHITEGAWLGNGAVFLPTDPQPLSRRESDALMRRLDGLHGDIRRLTGKLTAKQLAARPAKGRPIIGILQHLTGEGGYLRGVGGASRLQREVEDGRVDPRDALDELHGMEVERLAAMTAEERGRVMMRGQSPWSVRSAVRRMLEHGWEHYVEIAERLGVAP